MFRKLFGKRPSMDTPEFTLPADDAVTTTASGLGHELVTEGAGDAPGPRSTVTVHYAGWTTDGRLFDASFSRGQPATFPLNGVIPGWTEGLQLMKPGGVHRFVIPPDLAYGAAGAPPAIGPNETLVFHVELLSVS